jgi:hypothetical protein
LRSWKFVFPKTDHLRHTEIYYEKRMISVFTGKVTPMRIRPRNERSAVLMLGIAAVVVALVSFVALYGWVLSRGAAT